MFQHFELIRDQHIAEIASRARLFRHKQTGAEILSLENDDEHKVFGIAFRTPPTDSTGVAHIVEHSVLCGSRKYPVKEPFVELIKGSLRTYLNALTYPDKTCYPVASQNTRDFYNLIDVYFDAVFHPRLTPEIFQQEGWHYELNASDQPLSYKGVVFNEMKGAYGSPDRLLSEYARQSLFPDTTYGVSSGGDPQVIPDLTYEQFRTFHETYYHPSNARIFFYGDDDPEERLRMVQNYLAEYDYRAPDSAIGLQPTIAEPRTIERTYPIDNGNHSRRRGFMVVNWLLTETTDPTMNLALQMLGYVLVGMLASPLRKALVDSELGDDLVGGGFMTGLRQAYFSTGMKGIAVENAPAIEQVIFDCLNTLVRDGIDPDTIEAAVNTFEFHLRENNTGSSPRGLSLMMRSLTTWLHDGDPFAPLAFEKPLATIKAQLAANPSYFQDMIEQYLLNNNHRTTLVLKPDEELSNRQREEEHARLDKVRAEMSPQDIEQAIATTRHLKEIQQAPDSPEALATIPMLQLSDLDRSNKIIPLEVRDEHGVPVLAHNLDTTGIVYLDLGFSLHTVPQELLPYAALFGRIIREMGTDKEDYTRLAQRIGQKTGGIRTQPLSMSVRDNPVSTSWLIVRSKATLAQVPAMLDIVRDMVLRVQLDNKERFHQIALEARARKESSVIPGGSGFVNLRLRSCYDEADWVSEQMGGVEHLFFLRNLVDEVENDWPGVLAKLQQVYELLFHRSGIICNITVDDAGFQQIRPQVAAFLNDMPDHAPPILTWSPQYVKSFEGLTAPAQVNFVGKAANLYEHGYQRHGSMGVITNFLRTTWLWDNVRVQGGAYGCFCRFGRYSGILAFVSYRDPNLLDTLAIFDKAGDYLRQASLSDAEMTRNIIGAISHFDAYQLPDAKGFTSLLRYLTGHTNEIRQEKREEILSTTPADIRRFADMLDIVRDHGIVTVLGSPQAIEHANSVRSGFLTPVRVI